MVRVEAREARRTSAQYLHENITHDKKEIPELFWTNALLIASNGTHSRVGSLTAEWDRFFE